MSIKLPPADIIARAHSPRPRGYMPDWEPKTPATRRLLSDAIEALCELESVLPVTGRQLFYRLIAKDLIEKTETA